jgi:hypothetical protein
MMYGMWSIRRRRKKLRKKMAFVRFEVFTAMTMKNAFFGEGDIETQFVPDRKYYFSAALPS